MALFPGDSIFCLQGNKDLDAITKASHSHIVAHGDDCNIQSIVIFIPVYYCYLARNT